MKQYGANKSTEFTKKQINVVFVKAKNGTLKVEKWFIDELYNLAEYYGYDDNRNIERSEAQVLEILNAVFADENEKAQELIDKTADDWFNSYSRKNQAKCDRNTFVS